MSGSDKNLLQFIASTVETLRQRIDTMSEQMATKVDLANLKDEMEARIERLRAEMATKEELARVANDVSRLESNLDAKTTAIRGDIEQVHMRLDSIDRGVNNRIGQVEVDVSRIRSVVYLLVKDKPEMLRLLGQSNPAENRPQG